MIEDFFLAKIASAAPPALGFLIKFEEGANRNKSMAQARPARTRFFESTRGQGLGVRLCGQAWNVLPLKKSRHLNVNSPLQ